MNNTINYNPLSKDYCSTIQMKLPLNIGIKIDFDDPVVTFKEVMEGVNLKKYLTNASHETRGRDGYDPEVLLKIVLFAYMLDVRSTRKIESLCKNDIRFMYLSDEEVPSHMTICNFINTYLIDNIENIFNDVTKFIINKQHIDISTVYIDGTKMEAFPNRYTWVWKKACETSRDRQFLNISKLFEEINNSSILEPGLCFPIQTIYDIDALEKDLNYLLHVVDKESIVFVYGKGRHKKTDIQNYYEKLSKYIQMLKDYAIKIDRCGEERNSYSKTDKDATFMRMKTDYMGNTSLLPAYNWQLVTAGEIILLGLTSQSPSDNKCFIPLMEKYKSIYGHYPHIPVGDAGYGNYETYTYCKLHNIELYMKFPTWEKETHDKKFHENQFRSINFKRDEEGYLICPNHKRFIKEYEKDIPGNIDHRKIEYYTCEDCSNCPFRNQCFKGRENRTIKINSELTSLHQEVINNLASPKGILLREQRSYMAEGTFGVIKQDFNYRRITRVSLKKVNLEFYLVMLGFNLAKYYSLTHRTNELPC